MYFSTSHFATIHNFFFSYYPVLGSSILLFLFLGRRIFRRIRGGHNMGISTFRIGNWHHNIIYREGKDSQKWLALRSSYHLAFSALASWLGLQHSLIFFHLSGLSSFMGGRDPFVWDAQADHIFFSWSGTLILGWHSSLFERSYLGR